MTQQIPEGEFYSRLYVDPGAPREDSERFRNRLAAFFATHLYDGLKLFNRASRLGQSIKIETGYQNFDLNYFSSQFQSFLQNALLVDVFTGITLIWRHADLPQSRLQGEWKTFVERVLKEENLKYRVDSKCGIHPFVDREFERSRVSVLACLADARYAAVHHAVEATFEQLNGVLMDGKGAARNIFEAAETLTKIISGTNIDLDERFVDRELRPRCDRLFNDDPQLKATAGRLLSSFSKWVEAIHPYRHGHDRDQPLTLPDDLAVLTVSQGAGYIRWLVDIDRRHQQAAR